MPTLVTTLPSTIEAPVSEPTTPIKLSEAIRLGRLSRPLMHRKIFFKGDNYACTIGAMAIGLGYEREVGSEFALHFVQRYARNNFNMKLSSLIGMIPPRIDAEPNAKAAKAMEETIITELELLGA